MHCTTEHYTIYYDRIKIRKEGFKVKYFNLTYHQQKLSLKLIYKLAYLTFKHFVEQFL